jgi:hypothetical protein
VSSGGSPSGSADFAALMPDIKRLLAQPDQPFQPLGEPATEKCIAEALNVDYEPPYGIRASYWDPGRDDEWGNLLTEINNPPVYMPACIDDDGFETVQRQLAVEFDAVSRIRTYFGTTLHDALFAAYGSDSLGFNALSLNILSKYPPQQPEAQGASPFDIVGGVLDIGAELVPEGGEALGVVGATIEIAGAIADAGDSSDPYLGATVYEAQASQFASTLKKDFDGSLNALNRVADLLVSDAGRLQEAAQAVRGDWKINSNDLEGTVERSISAYMYRSLLPTTFKTYQCVMPPEYYGHPWYPAKPLKTPQPMRYAPFTTVTHFWVKDPNRNPPFLGSGADYADGDQINDGWVTIGRWWDGTHEYLDGDMAADIFGPLDSNDERKLGQLPVYFLAPQPHKDAPGFDLDQGSFSVEGLSSRPPHVQYSCGGNWWTEIASRQPISTANAR